MAASPSPKRVRFTEEDDVSSTESITLTKNQLLEEADKLQIELSLVHTNESKTIHKVIQQFQPEKNALYAKRNAFVKLVPQFWTISMLNHPHIKIHQTEVDCLNYLTNVELDFQDSNASHFDLTFVFSENPYFENTFITKEYRFDRVLELVRCFDQGRQCKLFWATGRNDENDLPPVTCTPIIWKVEEEVYQRLYNTKSFFWWLSCNEEKNLDMERAEVFREDLFPNPMQYYLLTDRTDSERDEDSDDVLILDDSDDVLVVDDSDEEANGDVWPQNQDSPDSPTPPSSPIFEPDE